MKNKLIKKGIASLWHFTDINNLPLIYKLGGLRSKESLLEYDVGEKISYGGNNLSHELDVRNGNWDKISLSFATNTPMFYHLKTERHFVFIEIDPTIVDENTYFTDTNATNNEHIREKGMKGLNVVKFEAFNERSYSDFWKYYSQAEILVPHFVPHEYFKKIHFMSESSLQMANLLAPEYNNKFISDIIPFEDFSWKNNNLPYIKDVIFTYQNINQSNCNDNFVQVINLIEGKELFFRIIFFPDSSGNIIVRFKDKDEKTLIEIRENLKDYSESLFWSEKGEFDTSILYNHTELYVDIYLNNVIYYKTYLST